MALQVVQHRVLSRVGPLPSRRRILTEGALLLVCLTIDLAVWSGDRGLRSGGQLPVWVVPCLAVPMMGLLVLRRQHPVGVLLAQVAWSCAGLLVPGYQPFTGLLVACYALAASRPLSVAAPVLATVLVPLAVDCWITASRSDNLVEGLAVAGALWLVLLMSVVGFGRRAWAVAQEAEQVRVERQQTVERAAEAVRYERLRLARELHDIVAHAVSIMLLQAAGARRLAASQGSPLEQPLTVIQDTGVQAMKELHRLLTLLRAEDGEPFQRSPGLEDLPGLLALAQTAGLRVQLDSRGERRAMDASVNLAAYRVIQEALTNAAKHAGPTADVVLSVRWQPDELVIDVRNRVSAVRTGMVSPAPAGGFGLRGLRERVEVVGGSLRIESADGWFGVHAEFALGSRNEGVIMET